MKPAAIAAIALLLGGCLSAPVERADRALEARVAQAEESARRTAAEALQGAHALVADADARTAARVAELAAAASTLRREAAADLDARVSAQRAELLAEIDRQRGETLAALDRQSAAWRDESAAWRATADHAVGEVAAIRESAAPLLEAFGRGATDARAPAPAGTTWPELLLTAVGAVVSTLVIRHADHVRQERAKRGRAAEAVS